MSEHHFILQYDTKTSRWGWSVETEVVKFDGKAIYLPDEQKWVGSSYTKELNDIDNELSEMLGLAIYTLNERGK